MKINIFLKSLFRKPIRTLFVIIVLSLVSFTFISRATEFILINKEVDRLSEYYRAIGTVESLSGTEEDDASEVAEYISENPYVLISDKPRGASGVIKENFYNANLIGFEEIPANDVFFYGTLISKDELKAEKTVDDQYWYNFIVDTVVAGYPEYVSEGKEVVLLTISKPEAALEPLEVGSRYLVRGCYNPRTILYNSKHSPSQYLFVPLADNKDWFINVAENEYIDLESKEFDYLQKEVTWLYDSQHSLSLFSSKDRSASPITQQSAKLYYLTDGRWLDYNDTLENNQVCMVHNDFARIREISVGDTIEVEVKNNSSYNGIIPYDEYWESKENPENFITTLTVVGTYRCTFDDGDYSDPNTATPDIYVPDSLLPENFYTESDFLHQNYYSFVLDSSKNKNKFISQTQDEVSKLGFKMVFVENGWEEFEASTKPMVQSSLFNVVIYSIVILIAFCVIAFIYFNPRRKDFAIARSLGLPKNKCISQIALPMFLQGFIGITIGGISAWIYVINSSQNKINILATSLDKTVEPLEMRWLFLFCAIAFLLISILTIFGAVSISKNSVLSLLQGNSLSFRTPKFSKKNKVILENQDSNITINIVDIDNLTKTSDNKNTNAMSHILKFALKHIVRSKVKSFMLIFLAAAFIIGLSAINLSTVNNEKHLDELYQTIKVDVEVVKNNSFVEYSGVGHGFIYEKLIDEIMQSGFIEDYYVEGASLASSVFAVNDGKINRSVIEKNAHILAIDNTEEFFRPEALISDKYITVSIVDSNGEADDEIYDFSRNGSNVKVSYMDGWDESLFTENWKEKTENQLYPVIVPRSLYESLAIDENGEIAFSSIASKKQPLDICVVAGVYDGYVIGDANPILMPRSALQALTKEKMLYKKVSFTIDSNKNRKINEFKTLANEILAKEENSIIETRLLMWDEELKKAVEPLEESISLMKLLYPITIALSVVISAGFSMLLIMLLSKDAAMMRIIGTTKLRSRMALCLQTIIPCIIGLIISSVVIILYSYQSSNLNVGLINQLIFCTMLYLVSTIIGSMIYSIKLTNRQPLEMLQVKE